MDRASPGEHSKIRKTVDFNNPTHAFLSSDVLGLLRCQQHSIKGARVILFRSPKLFAVWHYWFSHFFSRLVTLDNLLAGNW